jgi:hypothetical protein
MDSGIIDLPIGRPNDNSLIFGVTPQGKEAIISFYRYPAFSPAAVWSNYG